MTLHYLGFDFSENAEGDGTGSFDALASVDAAHVDHVRDEIAIVLDWARTEYPGIEAALEDGGDWQHDLQVLTEHAGARQLTTFSLTLAGTAAFCDALRHRFPEAQLD
ncbi:MAG: hypothetical protein EOO24_02670 [Comamonadaceae bacterium]|nr:MAG: hypothetical protein EOO24_02670 [Comamonadaceae bacterium]